MQVPEVLKSGDDSGNRMLVKYTAPSGALVYGIGVPQAWETPLGPTWCYVVEGQQLTVVDPGCHGSVQYLEEGLAVIAGRHRTGGGNSRAHGPRRQLPHGG